MGLATNTLAALREEYVSALTEQDVLAVKDEELNAKVNELIDEIRANKKQITSLRAVLKANGVDVKTLQ